MKDCRLALRQTHGADTIVTIDRPGKAVHIGAGTLTLIAGPCAVEDRDSFLTTAFTLKNMGAHILRGGAFKPRTSPYSFSGLEAEGLSILAEARTYTGLPVVTEVMDPRDLDAITACADILQIGSRNMQNYPLLREVGGSRVPILLKRGIAATIEEWLLAAEYILNAGNPNVILCERGIRTYERATRNTLDIAAVPLIKELAHLPVIVDPSHASGKRSLVPPLAKAAIAAGADGLMIEVHLHPDTALSDGEQSITPMSFSSLRSDLSQVASFTGRSI